MHKPASAVISAAISPVRARTMSAARRRIAARSWRVSVGRYARATANARRTSSSVAFGTVPTSVPS